MDAIETISNKFRDINYNDLPGGVVDATKRLILDTISVGLGGSSADGISQLMQFFVDHGGKQESSVWVFGTGLPCAAAAQLNATMVHALDFDDTHDRAVIHVGVTSVPTALAVAEQTGNVDGKTLITAVALGVEIASRLCLANTVSMFERGWHYTTLHGNFNATAVAGKLLALDAGEMINAYGLAYHQASGNLQGLIDGTLAKRLGPGFSVRNGITAVQMAAKGLTGPRNSLSGKHGFFNVYHRGDYEPQKLVDGLGETYEVANLSYKPYPCCRENHLSIDAALQLRSEFDIKPEDIKEITVNMSREGMVAVFTPLSEKQNPKNVVDAQFSTPWTVAWALVYGSVGIEAFKPEAICDEKVLDLSRRINPVPDDSLSQLGVSPTIVNIATKNGQNYTQKIEIAYGSPENPMTMQDMANKLKACAANADGDFSNTEIDELSSMCMNLEDLNDVRAITRSLSAPKVWS